MRLFELVMSDKRFVQKPGLEMLLNGRLDRCL